MPKKNQPNLFLIGGMRCGSTTLHNLLAQHPNIYMSTIKEPVYYLAEYFRQLIANGDGSDKIKEKLAAAEINGKYRTTKTYYSLFDGVTTETYIGESSHYFYAPRVAQTIFKDAPNARILILVRDPIKRLYSEHSYYVKSGKVSISFNQFAKEGLELELNRKKDEPSSQLAKGLYTDKILQWQEVFGADKVKVIKQEELVANISETSNFIFNWLGLEKHAVAAIQSQRTGDIKFKKLFRFLTQSKVVRKIGKGLAKNKITRMKLRAGVERTLIKKQSEQIAPEIKEQLQRFYAADQAKMKAQLGFNYLGY